MFSGNYSNSLDGKGRVAIPARFRETLSGASDDKLMLTIFEVAGVPCLEAYPARGWQDFLDELQSKIGSFSQNRLLFESAYNQPGHGPRQAIQIESTEKFLQPGLL